jgi:hypothetical protein
MDTVTKTAITYDGVLAHVAASAGDIATAAIATLPPAFATVAVVRNVTPESAGRTRFASGCCHVGRDSESRGSASSAAEILWLIT